MCKYVYRCMHVHEYLCMCECVYLWVHMYACTSMCHGGVIEVKRQLSGIGFLLQLSVLGADLGLSSLQSKHLYFPGYFLCLTFPPTLLSLKKNIDSNLDLNKTTCEILLSINTIYLFSNA